MHVDHAILLPPALAIGVIEVLNPMLEGCDFLDCSCGLPFPVQIGMYGGRLCKLHKQRNSDLHNTWHMNNLGRLRFKLQSALKDVTTTAAAGDWLPQTGFPHAFTLQLALK